MAGVAAAHLPLDERAPIRRDRNVTLTRFAGKWRGEGQDVDLVREKLHALNEAKCKPPLDAEEVDHIADSAAGWEPHPAPTALSVPPRASVGTARRMSMGSKCGIEVDPVPVLSGGILRLSRGSEKEIAATVLAMIEGEGDPVPNPIAYDHGNMWRFEEAGLWERSSDGLVWLFTGNLDGTAIGGGEKAKLLNVGARMMRNVYEILKRVCNQPGFFDAAPEGLTVSNGFVRVCDDHLEVVPWSPDQRSTFKVNGRYEPDAKPESFLTFLRQIWRDDADVDDKIELLRQFIGICLLGRATRYQKALILVGLGANGKSTLMEVVSALFKGAVTAIAPQEMEEQYRRALLAKSRLNVVSEMPEVEIMESGAIKAIISGDEITAREIREAPFTFRPRAGHVFSANALPGARDLTEGFWRRWLILTFNREFKEHEQDRTIARRIIEEGLGDIMSWALDGAVATLQAGSYIDIASSKSAIQDWRERADQVAAFIKARCWRPGDANVPSGVKFGCGAERLYSDFKQWASANGHKGMTSTLFGRRLASLGIEKRRPHEGSVYLLALRGPQRLP